MCKRWPGCPRRICHSRIGSFCTKKQTKFLHVHHNWNLYPIIS
jgi:hypothetical protein